MVLTEHKKFYDEIFQIKGFLKSPFLMFGFQELTPGFNPRLKDAKAFKGLLHLMGVQEVTVLDYEDPRADIHFDMNYPFNQNTNKFIGAFKVVCDIGCLEHVFNSAQAMKNCIDAVKVGGLYFLHTHIAGYCKHGLHTFNSDMLKWVVKNNGFEIIYCHYSDKEGKEIPEPSFNHQGNAIIWLVARRIEVKDKFHVPIQDRQVIHESRTTVKKVVVGNWDAPKGREKYPYNDGKCVIPKEGMSCLHEADKVGCLSVENSRLKHIVMKKQPISNTTGGYVGEEHDSIGNII